MGVDPNPEAWNHFAANHPQGSILQTTPWGELKSGFGWEARQVALTADGGPLTAGAQILCRRLPVLGQLAYVPHGPLVDWDDRDASASLLKSLEETARSHGAVTLTIEPNLPDDPRHRKTLTALGFRPSPLGSVQPRRTILVDLTEDEKTIMMAMKSKTRYNIRLAGRRGVTVRAATTEDIPTFNHLMSVTAERNEFGVHSPAYYERAFRLFVPRGWARLFLAEVEGDAVAALMAFALGHRAWYFYGASSTAHREKMPTYALQWAAMRWARASGCTEYDLWGIPDEDEETLEDEFTERSDGLWGVYRFKRGFGGEVVRSVGAWDRPLRPLGYRLYTLALRLRGQDYS
ncbi:MAG: peptidoglycan bridge formation glycyltransferase FemA/FemB family protein [Anaerolineae bacterium]